VATKKQFYVYLLANKSRTLYVGVTSNLTKRLYEHKNKLMPGFTSKYCINRLVYFEVCDWAATAIAREKQIKSWSRAKKVALIEENNRVWADLSEYWSEKADFSFHSK
jgi:putative endonuclease